MTKSELVKFSHSEYMSYDKKTVVVAEYITAYAWPYNFPCNALSLHNLEIEGDKYKYKNWYFGGQRVGKSMKQYYSNRVGVK